MLEVLKERVDALSKSVQESAARHNLLAGQLMEAQNLLIECRKCEAERNCEANKDNEPVERIMLRFSQTIG